MITDYKSPNLRGYNYWNELILLEAKSDLSNEEWAALYCKVQWALERECHEIFQEVNSQTLEHSLRTDGFMERDPTDLGNDVITLKIATFQHFSLMFAKLERLEILQIYLNRLKKLNK